jgi:intracellular sulfur oxidation DsrE/DsrF family protein
MTTSSGHPSTVILVTNDGMGKGDLPLQHRLLRTYLGLLDEHRLLPAVICFYTEGVKLVVEGSPLLEELKALEAKGVHLIICNTCLNHYDLADRVQVGVVGGMTDILEAQWRADKVITL